MTPKLIPECFKQDEILDRKRNPYKYMTIEELVYRVEYDRTPEDRWDAYIALSDRVGRDKCHELTEGIQKDFWIG